MKKNKKIILAFGIALMVFVNLKYDNTHINISSHKFTNVKALTKANAESGGLLLECYKTISSRGEGNLTHVTYCQDCDARLAKTWSGKNGCRK
jgi:hypothetical protein